MEHDGYVYCEVRKGMNGLKQSARLAFDNLVKLLAPHGYFPVREYPVLWKNHTRPIVFTLCVEYFCIKDNSMEDAHHLINGIKKYFKCSIDWEGQNYLGLTLDCNYKKKYVDISMPTSQPHCKKSSTNKHHAPKTPHVHVINLLMENTSN